MSVTAEELGAFFSELSDDALLDRWGSGTLTEVAQSVADAEVRKRGLDTIAPAGSESSAPDAAKEEPSDLETIFRSYNYLEARLLLGRMHAEGIPASLADVQTNNQLPITVGGVRIQTSSQHAERARLVAADFLAGAFALPDDAPAPREAPVRDEQKPTLWNPDVAALLSWFLFTSAFGALIHSANWRRLGDSERAVNSLQWAAAAVAGWMFVGMYGAAQHRPPHFFAFLVHVVYMLAWYFFSGREQSKHVVATLKGRYERRSWLTPVCVATIVLGFFLGIAR